MNHQQSIVKLSVMKESFYKKRLELARLKRATVGGSQAASKSSLESADLAGIKQHLLTLERKVDRVLESLDKKGR